MSNANEGCEEKSKKTMRVVRMTPSRYFYIFYLEKFLSKFRFYFFFFHY